MDIDHLVKMANQIEAFFRGEGNEAQAAQGVADHLHRFWDPRMRSALIAHVQAGGANVGATVRAAVALLVADKK